MAPIAPPASEMPAARNDADFGTMLSIVIPCFNEQEVLPQLFARVTKAGEELGCAWEVICVDDGSRDATWEMLKQQNKIDGRWQAVSLARNFGHQIALSAGLSFAGGNVVAVL